MAWSSNVIGAASGKLFFALAVVTAFAGVYRLAEGAPTAGRMAAGALYAFSPFVLTRIAVGHAGVVAALAILPWALPALLSPSARPDRTFLSCAALAFAGVAGAALMAIPLFVGVVGDRGRQIGKLLLLVTVAQLPWLVPALVVSSNGVRFASARRFATDARGPTGVLRLVAGHGFWRTSSQIGGRGGIGVELIGAALLLLAITGASRLRVIPATRASTAAFIALALALASAVPGADAAYAALSRTPAGLLIREGQRVLPVFLVWLAPAAVMGVVQLCEQASRWEARLLVSLPLIAAAVLAAPGFWGLGGAIRPVHLPAEWNRTRSIVNHVPGTVLALPFHEYLSLHVAKNRLVLNPLPDFLGGDVIASSDPELGAPHEEAVDPREATVDAVLMDARAGRPVSAQLARVGVRWIVLLHDVDWRAYAALRTDPGVAWVVRGTTLDLLRVTAWDGPGRLPDGRAIGVRSIVAPLVTVDTASAVVWTHAWARGWVRGISLASSTPDGLVALPAAEGPIWFWPAVIVLICDLITVVVTLRFVWNMRRNSPDS